MAFNPEQYLMDMRGKKYLETKYRIQWFRDKHPKGCISTEKVQDEPLLFKATVYDEEGAVLATGYASTPPPKGNEVWASRRYEKAETGAIGRALGHAGFGSQFAVDVDDTDDETTSGHLADAPANGKPSNVTDMVDKLGNSGERRIIRNWPVIFGKVRKFYEETDEEKAKGHWWNGTVKKLEKAGVLTGAMSDDQVVAVITAYKQGTDVEELKRFATV
jgi:hypothetical protein